MASPGKKKGCTKTGGRKKGTPNKATAEVRELAGEYTEDALKTLVQIMNDNKAAAAARIAAAKAVLDRGHGKPAQALELASKDDGPMKVVFKSFTPPPGFHVAADSGD
jgi:hypothetical protein